MFRKPSATAPRQTTSAMSGASFSVLGSDVRVTGDVTASAELHVDGTIEGDVTCATLVQGEGSAITGQITADSARLAGTVHGTITVGSLTIARSARIHGDVHYETLSIEQGAQVDGRLSQRGAEPKLLAATPTASAA